MVSLLAVENLSKSYGELRVLENASLVADDGKITVVAGPSGSGKTTLLRIIAGFEQADSGRILIGGKDVTGAPPWERGAVLMSQRPVLLPHFTVRKNIEFAYSARISKGISWSEIERLIDKLELRNILDKLPGQLSGGQLQRASLAAVLVSGPSIVLLDEPFAHLDLPLREQLRPLLRDLALEWEIPFVMVTHDQDEALEVADRLYVLFEGRLEGGSDPLRVYYDPPSLGVAQFLGHNIICLGGSGKRYLASFPPDMGVLSERGLLRFRVSRVRRRRGYVVVEGFVADSFVRVYLHPRDKTPKVNSIIKINIINFKKWNIECS